MTCEDGIMGDASSLGDGSDPDANEQSSSADTDASSNGTTTGGGTAAGSWWSLAQQAPGESDG